MKKLYIPVVDLVRPLAAALVGLLLLTGLLTFRLGTLHQGVSSVEAPVVQAVQAESLGGKAILQENSLYLPHKIGLYALEKTGFTSVQAIRGLGVLFGLSGAVAMALILLKWHTRRVAMLTMFLFSTSLWFLHSARWAAPETTYLLAPWLVYFGIRLQENNLRLFGLGIITLLMTIMLYIPGFVWFIVPAAIWQRQRLIQELRQAGRVQSGLLIAGTVVVLAPLLLTLSTSPNLIGDWLGMTGPTLGIVEFLKNLVGVPIQLFVRSDVDPAQHLGRLPYFEVATIVFIALGAYRSIFHRGLDRTKLLAGGLIIGSVLAACNFLAASVLLPFLYILVASGITFLLQQWFAVFPRNPLARNIGVVALVLVIGLTGWYHLRRYFVAWPQAPETRQAYSLPSQTLQD